MTTVVYSALGTSADLLGTDLIATWRSSGPLKTVTGAVAKAYFGADYLPLAGGTMTGALLSYAGSEGSPGVSFASDTDTGFYRIGANNIGIAVGGVKVADFASGASSIVGTLTATAFSGPLTGNVTGNLTGNVTGNVTGAVTGNATTATALATGRTISITGDMTYTSGSFDGSGNVTGAGTLATVNSNVGSFTNASITVNAKGLVTAASTGTAADGPSFVGVVPKTASYTLVLGDAGKMFYLYSSGAIVIPANASVAFTAGTSIRIYSGIATTISINTDGLSWFTGSAITTGTRNIAAGGWCDIVKYDAGTWYLTGQGIT